MFELGVLILVAFGAFWLFGALLVGVFKLTLGFFGALFGGVFALFAVGIAALLVLPIVFFAMLPVLVPVACVAALVWLIVRASRPDRPAPTSH
ncbi:MAG TPA: hypothetical protein VFW60_03250 [Rhodanobacteraceae bacterium]|nr:hypothetical protein [Rhodanobacteraceae bacterium]